MKQRISVTIDEKKMKLVEIILEKDSRFRSKSHFIEYSLDKALKEEMILPSFSNKFVKKEEMKNA